MLSVVESKQRFKIIKNGPKKWLRGDGGGSQLLFGQCQNGLTFPVGLSLPSGLPGYSSKGKESKWKLRICPLQIPQHLLLGICWSTKLQEWKQRGCKCAAAEVPLMDGSIPVEEGCLLTCLPTKQCPLPIAILCTRQCPLQYCVTGNAHYNILYQTMPIVHCNI